MVNPDDVVSKARALVERRRLVASRERLVVGVSGGADSVCLLDVLRRLVSNGSNRLLVVHVDHQIRPDSSTDAQFVRELVGDVGLDCHVAQVDAPGYARTHGVGLEHAGRALRYQRLAAAAGGYGARAVAVGHTEDDSSESLLMHLLRGAGVDGLRGIAAIERFELRSLGPVVDDDVPPAIRIIRPLLDIRRAETRAYCLARGLPFRDDPTNDDPALLRNRVRRHLLPVLRTYNPAIDGALRRTADLLREDGEWLDALVDRRRARLVHAVPDAVDLELRAWRRQPRAAQRRLVRRAAAELGVPGDQLGFDGVERALAFAAADRPARMQLAGRLVMTRIGDRVRMRRGRGGEA
ncbi:MAG: tRNA lysidine(34) synthetase TilS [Chloroflexi bacterium]|nr:tRNA lysidine(34) synthetase TilS [Chloroflexota bacterium]